MRKELKSPVLLLSICLLLAYGFTFPSGGNPTADECSKKLENLIRQYQVIQNSEKIYYKFYTITTEKEQEGARLKNELWKNGEKFRYQNEFMTVIQDENFQLTILKESQTIFIRNTGSARDNEQSPWNASVASQLGDLKKIVSRLECSESKGEEKVTMEFPKIIQGKTNYLKQVILEFTSSGNIRKGTYEYNKPGGINKQVYEYETIANNFPPAALNDPALTAVKQKSALPVQYKNYQVKDLRSKK